MNNKKYLTKGLKSISNLKAVYSTDEDDLLNDFLTPCLSNSIKYDRISGFFSSILYSLIFRGIKSFIEKENSKIRLIIGFLPRIEKKILSKNNLELYEFLYNDNFIKDVNNQFECNEPMLKKNHLKLLAWLIINNKIEIKLGLLIDDEGFIVNDPNKVMLAKGKLHKKLGIFYDEFGNSLSFCGSNNETPYGWEKNFEEFDLHYSWDGTLQGLPWLEKHQKKFEDYWVNNIKGLITLNLPDKCIEKLKGFAPNNFGDIEIDKIIEFYNDIEKSGFKKALENNKKKSATKSYWKKNPENDGLILDKFDWPYHAVALSKWIENDYIGLFEMATGTGKTITSIKCIHYLFNRIQNLVCWILVPDKFLIEQWALKLEGFTDNAPIIRVSNKRSREKLNDLLFIFKKGSYNFLFFLSTTKMIEKIKTIIFENEIKLENILLIIDEAHSIGAQETRKSIENFFPKYRIGLTATPKRYYDPIGTKFIEQFFNKVVYKLSLSEALDLKILCPYEYYIYFCELKPDENDYYENLTKKILLLDQEKDEDELIKLYNLRADIIKKATCKKEVFKILLKDLVKNNEFNKCLIYCDDHEQLNEIHQIIRATNSGTAKIIDGDTSNKKRLGIIRLLENKHINTILAMKCLDQGVDMPFLKIGIFLSSSGNEKEFIQRRGRLMRKYPKKDLVKIFDIVIKKKVEEGDAVYKREKERIRLFSNLANNKDDVELDYFDELGDFF